MFLRKNNYSRTKYIYFCILEFVGGITALGHGVAADFLSDRHRQIEQRNRIQPRSPGIEFRPQLVNTPINPQGASDK